MKRLICTLIVVAIAVLLILFFTYNFNSEYFSSSCADDCVKSHSQQGENYVWLKPLNHGEVRKVEFEEPVGSGKWTLYTDKWWRTHCDSVNHDPNTLVVDHIKAFVNPATRFARLRFTFEDGAVLEPTRVFYELEAEYFKDHKYCQ